MHHVAIEPSSATVEVTLSGLMSPGEVDAYMIDLRQAIACHRLDAHYGIVVDVTGCTIQTQDVIRTMGAHMATMPRARAIAIVATSSLARMQIRRLFVQDYARIVATREQARGWVIDGREPGGNAAATPASPR